MIGKRSAGGGAIGRRLVPGLALLVALILVAVVAVTLWGPDAATPSSLPVTGAPDRGAGPTPMTSLPTAGQVAPLELLDAAGDDADSAPAAEDSAAAGMGALEIQVHWGDDGTPAADVALRIIAWEALRPLASARLGRTNADGQLSVRGLPPGEVTVYADRGGTNSAELKPDEVTTLALEIPPGHWVDGLVVDPDGEPVPGADIWLSSYGNTSTGQLVTAADAGGRFSLRSVGSMHSLGARGQGHGPSPLVTLLPTDASVIDVVLHMSSDAGAVTVLVVDADDEPVAGAAVRLGGNNGWPQVVDDEGVRRPGPPPVPLVTDGTGRCQAEGLPVGPMTVLVRAPGHSPWEGRRSVESAGVLELSVQLAPAARVEGRVFRVVNGEPVLVPGGRVSATSSRVRYADLEYTATESDADGVYALDGVVTGTVTITAQHDDFGKHVRKLQILPGKTYAVDHGLSRGLELRGRLTDEHGAALEGWAVKAEHMLPVSRVWRGQATVDAAGGWAIPNCEDVAHRLKVFQTITPWIPAHVVEDVRPGGAELALVVPSDKVATGEVAFALVDANGTPVDDAATALALPHSQDSQSGVATGVAGGYRAGPVPPGRYALRVRSSRYPPIEVPDIVVGPGQTVDLGTLWFERPGWIVVTVSAPPGLSLDTLWLRFRDGYANTLARMSKPTDDPVWRSTPLAAGTYRIETHCPSAASQILSATVHPGQETAILLDLQPGVLHLFELHGLADCEAARSAPRGAYGLQPFFLEVRDGAGEEVASIRHELDRGLADGALTSALTLLTPGAYRVAVLIGGMSVGEADFVVQAGGQPGVTRVDVR